MPLLDKRNITHLDLDTFFVSVEVRANSKLKGKPVLIGGSNARGVVASCSYEARKFGIHSAMPMYQAIRLCPHAIVIHGDHEAYSKASHEVTDIIREFVPIVEKASIDEFYIDLTGMEKNFGCSKFSQDLKTKLLKETALPISWALASNKLISKVGTNEAKPNGQLVIPFGNEKIFLSDLHVAKLPGIGLKTQQLFKQMGVQKIRTLAEMQIPYIQSLLGDHGIDLWKKAQGIDDSPVIPFHEQKSFSTEHTFQEDTADNNFLNAEIVRMTESLAFAIRSENRLTACVTIKIRYSDRNTFAKQTTIPYTNSDHILIQVAKELFKKIHTRRLMIRLIGIRFTNLISGTRQFDLFVDTQEDIKLYQAMDSIKKQFGEKYVIRAAGL